MKTIVKQLIPANKKQSFIVPESRQNQLAADAQQRYINTESQWRDYSAAAIMRKTIDVIA